MQKRCFPLPEAPGCSLICRAALGLPALHRRPLDEGTEMEQGRGTDNHCWGDALTAPSECKSDRDVSPEATSLREGWWRTPCLVLPTWGSSWSHQLQPLTQPPPRNLRDPRGGEHHLRSVTGQGHNSCHSHLSTLINRLSPIWIRE